LTNVGKPFVPESKSTLPVASKKVKRSMVMGVVELTFLIV